MKKKLCVAVIDSGVNEEDSYLKNTEIKNLYYEEREFKTCYAGKLNPHGTEVIKVLLKEAPDIRILSIRTLREDNRCMISAIINSIRYCIDERVDIINLSLGSCGPTARRLKDLRDICDEATEKEMEVNEIAALQDFDKIQLSKIIEKVFIYEPGRMEISWKMDDIFYKEEKA